MGLAQRVARKLAPTVNGWVDTRWYGSPLGEAPRADPATYLSLAHAAADQCHDEIDAFERAQGFAVDREWLDELALHTQIVIKESRLCYQHGRILYAALRHYLKGRAAGAAPHLHIVETGTAAAVLGNPVTSVAWLAQTIGEFDVALEPGHVVLPGSCTRAVPVRAGDAVRADFDTLGHVEVSFS